MAAYAGFELGFSPQALKGHVVVVLIRGSEEPLFHGLTRQRGLHRSQTDRLFS
jgi:hypothetical protein